MCIRKKHILVHIMNIQNQYEELINMRENEMILPGDNNIQYNLIEYSNEQIPNNINNTSYNVEYQDNLMKNFDKGINETIEWYISNYKWLEKKIEKK